VGAATAPRDSVRDGLLREARALAARIQAQAEQADRLRALAARIDGQTAEDRQALQDLEGLLGEATQLGIDDFDQRLGGQRLERVAVRLLRERERAGEQVEIHYREWFDLLRSAGHEVAGKNPLGTFLAQLNRSVAIERVGSRTGRYRLRAVA
jgi:hypothetical protein